MTWRSEARRALREYPKLKRKCAAAQQITPDYGGVVVQHAPSRTTENAALNTGLSEREETVVRAVDFAMEMQKKYYNAEARLLMVKLVYWTRTHTLEGAAVEAQYSVEAVKRWNTEILTAVYVGLQKGYTI